MAGRGSGAAVAPNGRPWRATPFLSIPSGRHREGFSCSSSADHFDVQPLSGAEIHSHVAGVVEAAGCVAEGPTKLEMGLVAVCGCRELGLAVELVPDEDCCCHNREIRKSSWVLMILHKPDAVW